jgi:hypothetical protein
MPTTTFAVIGGLIVALLLGIGTVLLPIAREDDVEAAAANAVWNGISIVFGYGIFVLVSVIAGPATIVVTAGISLLLVALLIRKP